MFALLAAGCDHHASSDSVQPARTFPAAGDANAKSKYTSLSRPIGCGGNPYYYDHTLRRWVYFDAKGKMKVSPNQPPCVGADEILRRSENTAVEDGKKTNRE